MTWASASAEPLTQLLTAARALTARRDRPLRSRSGRFAVVVSLDALRASPDFDTRVDVSARGQSVALLLNDTDASSFAGELSALCSAGDLVAAPRSLAARLPGDFSPIGRIVQHVDPALPDTLEVWQRRAAEVDLLTRGAPVRIDEGPENLTGRAEWFRKRHSGGSGSR